jgi:hypothetical protein
MEGRLLDRVTSVFELDLPPHLQTMREYIEHIVPQVQQWSEDLRETQFWHNKRWHEIHDSDAWDRAFIHMFMPDGEHLVSDNGKVSQTAWRFLPNSNSLILSHNRDTIMYDLVFLNGDMMILRRNGTADYFVLGEERFVKKIKNDWRTAMEALFNIYRENSRFSLYIILLILFVVAFLVFTLTE